MYLENNAQLKVSFFSLFKTCHQRTSRRHTTRLQKGVRRCASPTTPFKGGSLRHQRDSQKLDRELPVWQQPKGCRWRPLVCIIMRGFLNVFMMYTCSGGLSKII
jgi:hypothetical protein